MSKVIILDWSIFVHRSIFALQYNPSGYPTYTAMQMIFASLKRIGVQKDDLIIIACDFLRSWRKQLEEEYKANRQQKRQDSGLDWNKWFRKFDELLEELDIATNWHTIRIPHIEADDIMAVCSRYYKDKEVVLVTYDSDLEQCWTYPNVKIYSPLKKEWKLKPENFNVNHLIASKVAKEVSDNLVSPILNEEDYQRRLACITLIDLPEWVETKIKTELDKISEKPSYPEAMPFAKHFQEVYENLDKLTDSQIIYEVQEDKLKQKELRKIKKKQELKEKEQKRKLREQKKFEKEQLKLLKTKQ